MIPSGFFRSAFYCQTKGMRGDMEIIIIWEVIVSHCFSHAHEIRGYRESNPDVLIDSQA